MRCVGVVVRAARLGEPGSEQAALDVLRIRRDEVDVARDARRRVRVEGRDLRALDHEQRALDGGAGAREVGTRRESEGRPEALGLGGGLGNLATEGTLAARRQRLEPVHGQRPLIGRFADQAIDARPELVV